MQIAQSQIVMNSTRTSEVQDVQRERLRVWRDGGTAQAGESGRPGGGGLRQVAESLQVRARAEIARVEISRQAAALQPSKALVEADTEIGEAEQLQAELNVSLLKALVERMTGREIKLMRPQDLHPRGEKPAPADPSATKAAADAPPRRLGWGVVYDHYQSHYESETTRFHAEGVVQTADGREIAIQLDLGMSREFFSEEHVSLRADDALKDPLVINFSGTAAELTQRDFSFDLDLDGRSDQIAFVRSGSGFLALDRNGDGEINDGGELFGAVTGDGFAELAAFDADGNAWIDEADPIYDGLRIWSKDAAGRDQLVGLGERNVGAIYLGHVATQFSLNLADNQPLGQVASSGIFLQEEGGVGTVQQIDLVV